MKSMFYNAGSNATSWTVKISGTTGSLTNTTSKWYGSFESVYRTMFRKVFYSFINNK